MSDQPKPLLLPAPVTRVLGQVKAWIRALPLAARVTLFTVVGALIVAGAYATVRGAYEPYATLFSQMDRDDASGVVTKLKELKVPYRLGAEGTTIEVPEARVMDVRLELASAGLPRGGGIGFESFDKMRLGSTEFEQRVLYKRALEGELARTIGSLGAVQTARVHLVMPDKSVFVSRTEPASASIIVKLRGGRSLGPAEVSGIVHLTASSVPNLQPERITLVTTEGAMLHKPRAGNGDDPSVAEDGESSARTMENTLEERARAMLEHLVGAGHADVRVSAEMDTAKVEHVEDHYEPSKSVLRSEEESIERVGADTSVAGVPGAESNLPGASGLKPAPAASATPSASAATSAAAAASAAAAPLAVPAKALTGDTVRTSHTRNFEIDHVSEKRVRTGNAVRRITVAVVLDGVPHPGKGPTTPRTREELDQIAGLMRGAIGIDASRGDVLTVESIPFLEAEPVAEAPVVAPFPVPAPVKKFGPLVGVGVLVVAVLAALAAGRRRRAKARSVASALGAAPSVLGALNVGTPITLASVKAVEAGDPRLLAHERALRDPATAALILRAWLGVGETSSTHGVDAE